MCISAQAIFVPLVCQRNIHNINLRSRISLTVNLWLLVHFVYLCINYSYYNACALCYRLCCIVWMIVDCYPDQTYSTYQWFEQQLPDWIRPFLCDLHLLGWSWDLTTVIILTLSLLQFLYWDPATVLILCFFAVFICTIFRNIKENFGRFSSERLKPSESVAIYTTS